MGHNLLSHMETTNPKQTYADWLRDQMTQRELTQRGLAKIINPDDPETARRSVRRYLKGMTPIERSRRIIAEALGSDELGPDDDAEDD